jgi:non-canonical (house-cleaning) NTP pyrophosphatase
MHLGKTSQVLRSHSVAAAEAAAPAALCGPRSGTRACPSPRPTWRLRISVGSTNEVKVDAVRIACATLGLAADVVGVPVRSTAQAGEGTPGLAAIGIENGVVQIWGGDPVYVDLAVVVLLVGGREWVATSAGVQLDVRDVRSACLSGRTAGAERAARTGCDPADSMSHATGGEYPRSTILAGAVAVALSQWLTEKGDPA